MANDKKDFKSLQDEVQAALVSSIKTAGQISSEDVAFHRSFNPDVGKALDQQNARLLALANELLKSASSVSGLNVPALEDADDVDSNWRSVVDVVDSLLEKTDTCLDEYTGIIKRNKVEEVRFESQLPSSYLLISASPLRHQNLRKNPLTIRCAHKTS